MKDTQVNLAIKAALSRNWKKAILLNKKILEENPEDIEALNRLGFAHIQVGNLSLAKKAFQKVLALDKYNSVAKKNLDRIETFSTKKKSIKEDKSRTNQVKGKQAKTTIEPRFFIEEPGKTKIVNLINPAPAKTLSTVNIGDCVSLYSRKRSIEVRNEENKYLGALPDDVAFRLLHFLKAGNKYDVCVKKVKPNNITVFIREVKRGKHLIHQPTFSLVVTSK